ncbi:MAG: TetR/AcrR family transcriptional regulator [Acidimicrobiales bacterium]
MPRIKADTVAEHVAHQEAAVIAAATRLFAEHGVDRVSLGDIAAEVGLKRNSIYRYFPDKGHILAAWFRSELAPLIALCREIATSDAPAAERLDAWMTTQLEYLTNPEHTRMLAAANELTGLSDDVRDDIGAGHRDLYSTLTPIVVELLKTGGTAGRDARLVTMLLVGVLRSSAELVDAGSPPRKVRAEMLAAARAITAG